MNRRFLIAAGTVVALVLVGGIICWQIGRLDHRLRLSFLSEKPLIASGMEAGTSGDYYEYEYYSWPADFGATRDSAAQELQSKGFIKNNSTGVWRGPAGELILISIGRSKDRTEAIQGSPVLDTKWVTVSAIHPISGNWMNRLRLFLQRGH